MNEYGRTFWWLTAQVACIGMWIAPLGVEAEEPISVAAGQRILLFDDAFLESRENITRTVNQPVKHPSNPVLRRENSWEGYRVQVYGTVIHDPEADLFKAWYMNIPATAAEKITVQGQRRPGHATLLSYATSKDGIVWEKPVLNLVDFEGSTANNMIAPDLYNPEGFSVLYEPNESDPQRRYKAFYWDHGRGPLMMYEGQEIYGEGPDDGMHVAFSPDGIHWTPYAKNPVMKHGSDTGQVVLWDPAIRRYVAYGRFGAGGRKVARSDSPDFIHWSEPKLVLEPDEKDGPNTQFYGVSVDLYHGIYIGMLWMFYIEEASVGRLDFQLCHSYDGIAWHRDPERRVFMPGGPEGAWDWGDMRAACRSVILDDRVLVYYAGSAAIHGLGSKLRIGMDIGLATLRRDGWVSLDAGETPGTLLTKPFAYPGGSLHVNADTRNGSLRIEMLQQDGQQFRPPIVSTLSARDAIKEAVPLALPPAAAPGTHVLLMLTLTNGKLYSLWFE
ncbi:MAG: hypothetical protein HUU46_18305 [Candidatus Hydrogenedentes bacterium]|nr:hypothetical protein [Candidatus Hydrogenedentota bacterium]